MRSMVEGQPRKRRRNDAAHHCLHIPQRRSCRDAQDRDTSLRTPPITRGISHWLIAARMHFAIDLDRQPSVTAVKVEDIAATGMLAAKLQPRRAGAKNVPQQHFGQRHGAAQAAGTVDAARGSFRRDVFQHPHFPSTMLRMVPLPEQSSGRI